MKTFLYYYKSNTANDTDGPTGIEWDCSKVPEEAIDFFEYKIIDD